MDFRLQFKVQSAVARKSKQQEIGSYLQSGNREGGVHVATQFSFTVQIVQDASQGLVWPTMARSSCLSQCNQDDPHRPAQRPIYLSGDSRFCEIDSFLTQIISIPQQNAIEIGTHTKVLCNKLCENLLILISLCTSLGHLKQFYPMFNYTGTHSKG